MENEYPNEQMTVIEDEGEALVRERIKKDKNSNSEDVACDVMDILIEKYNLKHIRDILYLEAVFHSYAAYCKEMLK